MDDALEKALEFSNFTATLNNQKRILHEKYTEELGLYYCGGKFTVTKELLTFCHLLLSKDISKTVVIDDNNSPIQIDDIDDFMTVSLQQYATAANKYFAHYKELSTKRSVEGLADV